jgi:hypothetical protein
MAAEPSVLEKQTAAFIAENPYAAEADRLLQQAIEQRSEWILRRAETYATLAVAFEQRQTRFDLYVGLENHAQQTGAI